MLYESIALPTELRRHVLFLQTHIDFRLSSGFTYDNRYDNRRRKIGCRNIPANGCLAAALGDSHPCCEVRLSHGIKV